MTDTTPRVIRSEDLAVYGALFRIWYALSPEVKALLSFEKALLPFEEWLKANDDVRRRKAEEYLRQARLDDTHSSDVEPQVQEDKR